MPHSTHVCGLAVILLALAASSLPALDVDDKPLVPRAEIQPDVPAKYRIDASRAMFRAIEDDNPIRTERENADEYRAWADIIGHARQFPVAELEKVANPFLTSEDLIRESRRNFQFKPIRFRGLIVSASKQEASRALQEFGIKETYLARLVPAGEPFRHQLLLVFSDLPAGVDSVEKLKDRWVSFAGYSFKLMAEEPEKPQGVPVRDWKRIPVLIGQSVTLLPGSPEPEGDAIESIPNKDLRIFQLIRDEAPIAGAEESAWPENAAWNWVAMYARKFSQEDLEKHARRGLTFADLFGDGRHEYKLDLVHFEGKLIRLRADKPPRLLREAGVKDWYEGWLIPANQPPGQAHPICIILTELPPGLEPAYRMNKPVSFAGYSFKKLHYESSETDPSTKKKWKAAPMLIGRSLTLLPEEPGYTTGTWSNVFVPLLLAGLGGIVATAALLSWWFRRGDKEVKAILSERQTNPFGN